MKKGLSLLGSLCLCVLVFCEQARCADATAGVDFATAYVFRGVAINDRAVMQPSLEVSTPEESEYGVLTLGTWANFDMKTASYGSPKSGDFSEVDLYAWYALPLGIDPVTVSLGYAEFTYPNTDADSDRELSLLTEIDTVLSPSLGVYVGTAGATEEQVYLEGTLGHDFELAEDLSLNLGGVVGVLFQGEESDADDGFSFASLSAGLSYSYLTATVTYIFETDEDVTEVEEDVVGMLGLSVTF